VSGPRVLVVAQQLRRRVPGGIGTYARALLHGLAALSEDDGGRPGTPDGAAPAVSVYASRAPSGGAGDPLARLGYPVVASRLPGPLLTRAWDRGLVRAPAGFDVVHSVSLAAPPARGVPEVVTVHDVAWRHRPDAYDRRGRRWHEAAFTRALGRAAHLVVPSEPVARDVTAAGADAGAVSVIAPGSDHLPPPDDAAAGALLASKGVTGPFVLSVGTIEPRKNLPRLFAAYQSARRSMAEPLPLVVVGPVGWGPDVGTGEGVVFAGRVGDATLAALYRRARLLAYVPLEEGYGLPPLEAMYLGTPVVSSAVPGAGTASLTVEPTDVEQMARAIVEVASDHALRARLVAAGRAHAAGLTWAATARAHARLWASLP